MLPLRSSYIRQSMFKYLVMHWNAEQYPLSVSPHIIASGLLSVHICFTIAESLKMKI